MICMLERRGRACVILASPRRCPASPHAHVELTIFRLDALVSDLNGGKRWYLSDKDLTRHGDRLCYADTRFDLNPLNPIACSERT